LPADEILGFSGEREIDRIVMGTHSRGPIGKLLVGSVAEAVLRRAIVPVCIVGPEVVDASYRNFATRTILCAASLHQTSGVVATFAAELARQQHARLIVEHVMSPEERSQTQAKSSVDELEAKAIALVPEKLKSEIELQTVVVPGDPTEELLYQSRAQQADLIVLGAQGASAFAAVTRHGLVYKVLAHALCPVITLSPLVLGDWESSQGKARPEEAYIAGAF
jgi:nucleotide-binding universal stress UspA family protein